jgi:hypothetical protein
MIIFNHEPLSYKVILGDMLTVMTTATTATTTNNDRQQHSIGLHTQ